MKLSNRPAKLEFLEGIRALAMLVVIIFHALTVPTNYTHSGLLLFIQRYSLHGQVGVVVFIVLSGYCLMLPVVHSEDRSLRGGLKGFLLRRATRLLPAYYAALILSIGIAGFVTLLHSHMALGGHDFSNVLTVRNIVTHVLMIHNLFFDTAFSLNGPLWSVATEWQIYFVFALVLLPLWRRFGIWVTVLTAYVLGILPSLLLPANQNYYWARPWYLGFFAMGMTAAVLHNRKTGTLIPFREMFLLSGAVLVVIQVAFGIGPSWPMDTLIAFCATCLIGFCAQVRDASTNSKKHSWENRLLAFLESPWLLYLASLSYSAYLLQHIVFKGILTVADKLHLSGDSTVAINCMIGIPVSLLLAHFFAQVFEKPFISNRTNPLVQGKSGLPRDISFDSAPVKQT